MSIRARKSDHSEDWYVEREIPCINGLSAWFIICTAEEADDSSMGYTDGDFGTAEERANQIARLFSSHHRAETPINKGD